MADASAVSGEEDALLGDDATAGCDVGPGSAPAPAPAPDDAKSGESGESGESGKSEAGDDAPPTPAAKPKPKPKPKKPEPLIIRIAALQDQYATFYGAEWHADHFFDIPQLVTGAGKNLRGAIAAHLRDHHDDENFAVTWKWWNHGNWFVCRYGDGFPMGIPVSCRDHRCEFSSGNNHAKNGRAIMNILRAVAQKITAGIAARSRGRNGVPLNFSWHAMSRHCEARTRHPVHEAFDAVTHITFKASIGK